MADMNCQSDSANARKLVIYDIAPDIEANRILDAFIVENCSFKRGTESEVKLLRLDPITIKIRTTNEDRLMAYVAHIYVSDDLLEVISYFSKETVPALWLI